MKRNILWLCVLAVMLLSVSPVYALEQTGSPVIAVQSCSAEPMQKISVPVVISDNPGFAGFALEIIYDAEVLELTGVQQGDLLPEDGYWADNRREAGSCRVAWFRSDDVTGDGCLLELEFTVSNAAEVGISFIGLRFADEAQMQMVNDAGQTLSCTLQDGAVSIEPSRWHVAVEETECSADKTSRTVSAWFSHYDPANQGDAFLIAAGYRADGKQLDVAIVAVSVPMIEPVELPLSASSPIDCIKVFLVKADGMIPMYVFDFPPGMY